MKFNTLFSNTPVGASSFDPSALEPRLLYLAYFSAVPRSSGPHPESLELKASCMGTEFGPGWVMPPWGESTMDEVRDQATAFQEQEHSKELERMVGWAMEPSDWR